MWIQAIRLREVGPFVAPVRVAGLAPGLNVLSAPNEAGKSTVFRAVDVLFREKHTSAKQHKVGAPATAKTLQPVTGGAPWVSCAFQIDDVDWALTKQFLQQRSAEFARCDGEEVLRGDDVDPRLSKLLARDVGFDGLLPLLWVGQREGLSWTAPEAGAQTALRGLAEREAAAASGGGALEEVLAAVKRDLDKLLTPKRTSAKTGGPLHGAQVALKEAAAAFEQASDAAMAAQARREEAEQISAQLKVAADPDEQARLATLIAACREQLAGHARAEERFQSANKTVEIEARSLGDSEKRLAAIDELSGLRRAIETAAAARVEAEVSAAQAATDLETAQSNERIFRVRAAAVEQLLQAAEATSRVRMSAKSLQDAQGVATEIANLEQRVTDNPATAERIDHLEELNRSIDRVEAQLTAAAPRIAIAYESEAPVRIEADGARVERDTEIVADAPVLLVIPGVGQVTVSPAMDAARGDAMARLEVQRGERDALLDELGVSELTEARELARLRAEAVAALQLAQHRLSDLAPAGLGTLEHAVSSLTQTMLEAQRRADETVAECVELVGADDNLAECAGDQEALRARHQLARNELAIAEQALVAARGQHETCLATVRDRTQEIDHAKVRAAAQADLLGLSVEDAIGIVDLDDIGRQASAAKSEAEERYRRSINTRDEYGRAKLATEDVARIEEQAADADQRLRQRQGNAARLRTRYDELSGAMEADRQAGVGEALRRAEEDLALTNDEVERLQAKADALQMLESEIQAEIASKSSSLILPIVSRMVALIGPVIGKTTLDIGPDFTASTVERDGTCLAIDRLSGGTQEQLAIVSRLAYGQLLADHGQGLPFVMDDALVYADDDRRRAMFAVLAEAGERHQVIVLTCHAQSAMELEVEFGANRISIAEDAAEMQRAAG